MREATAIKVPIFESSYFGSLHRNMIAPNHNYILLLLDNGKGTVKVDLDNPPFNLCHIVEERYIGRKEPVKHIEPVYKEDGMSWSNGGCLCFAYNENFTSPPLLLHDILTEDEE